ncbi:glycosyltransferase [Microbacterium bovistercoris]|uniref:Glycosyltransferase n=1 Tax=Microbacterium bovistercoris TaxID=2293570 RepID=A0A371NXZ5_9MICO|nr:glycosyltransferase [Microbacterium bovistercoris]
MAESGPHDISVIVPCKNATSTLPLLLESLATQRTRVSFEVILSDNRSGDGLRRVALDWKARLPQLRVVDAFEESGASYARNVGADAARSSRLMFCDADDVVSATWIDHGARAFQRSELWSGAALPVDDTEFGSDVESLRQRIGDSSVWEELVDDQDGAFPILMGGNFGVKAEVYRRLGGFDQSLPTAGEDNDLAVRARLRGRRIPIAPSVRIAYRIRTSSSARRRQQYQAAVAHSLLASRYGLWSESPYPVWWIALARAFAAMLRMTVIPRTRDWSGLSERMASALGFTIGTFRYRYLRRLPPPRLGVGLTSRLDP